MAPRKTKHAPADPQAVTDQVDGPSAVIFTSNPNCLPKLATIPPELFDEIFSYFPTLPLIWYQDTSPGGFPIPSFFERTKVLRAIAGTCRALRLAALPRLWSRIDACHVPERSRGIWYKHVMEELKRKAAGVEKMDETIRGYVRTLSFMVTKSDIKSTVTYLPRLLSALSSLHTIHILGLRVTSDFKVAVANLSMPSVRMLVIPTEANSLVKACPNVTHVRCASGDGSALIAALKGSKCTVLDGMIDWVRDPKLTTRVVKNAPHLMSLEIRRPVIPALSGLKELQQLIITFPRKDEVPSDVPSIKAARKVIHDLHAAGPKAGKKKLVVRRVEAPHYANDRPHDLDLLLSEKIETFEKH